MTFNDDNPYSIEYYKKYDLELPYILQPTKYHNIYLGKDGKISYKNLKDILEDLPKGVNYDSFTTKILEECNKTLQLTPEDRDTFFRIVMVQGESIKIHLDKKLDTE